MNRMLAVTTLLCCGLVGGLWAPTAHADAWNEMTIETFSEPVEVPGKVLPAGTYVFKLLDSEGARNIVQIFNGTQQKLYATVLGITDYRMKPADRPIIRFEESLSTSPEAIKAWFYPGRTYGVEFVYPESRAKQIAMRTHQNVLSMNDAMAANLTRPTKSAKESQVVAMKKTPVRAVSPTGTTMDMDQVVSTHPK